MFGAPPISPLFPTPPLSRSGPGARLARRARQRERHPRRQLAVTHVHAPPPGSAPADLPARARLVERRAVLRPPRSEEHTSELQSPDHLVCRLLLEKKKIQYH